MVSSAQYFSVGCLKNFLVSAHKLTLVDVKIIKMI